MSTHELKISSRIELIDEKLARIGEPDALAQLETQKNDCLSSIARLKYETLTFDAQALIFYKWVLVRTFRQIDGEELVSSDIDDMEGIDFLKIANIDVSFTTHSRDAKPTKHKKNICEKFAWNMRVIYFVFVQMKRKRSDVDCQRTWQHVVHPKINRGKFTKAEDERLLAIIRKYV